MKYEMSYISRDHPYYCMTHGGAAATHRLIMAEHLGRPLAPNEFVYFRDGDCKNISIDNLGVTEDREHIRLLARKRSILRIIDNLTEELKVIEAHLPDNI